MFEELLEDIAQRNGLRLVNTYLKLGAGIGAIILCLLSGSYVAPIFIAFLLTCGIIFLARVDAKTYAELFIYPFWFAVMSVTAIVLIFGGETVFWRLESIAGIFIIHNPGKYQPGIFCFLSNYWGYVCCMFYCSYNAHDRTFHRHETVQRSPLLSLTLQ